MLNCFVEKVNLSVPFKSIAQSIGESHPIIDQTPSLFDYRDQDAHLDALRPLWRKPIAYQTYAQLLKNLAPVPV